MINIKATNTILYCKKWDEVVSFYKFKLKLEVSVAKDWFVEFKLTDGAYLSIADESRASVKSSQGKGITITFEVDDIESTHRFLEDSACRPSLIKEHAWSAKIIHFFDPEGNRLEFWSRG